MRVGFVFIGILFVIGCSRSGKQGGQVNDISPPEVSLATLDESVAQKIRSAQQQVREQPKSAAAWGRLGEIFHAAEFFEPAQLCYTRASELEPNGRWLYLL